MAASRCHDKSFKGESALESMQNLGTMLNVLKMSQLMRVSQYSGDMLNIFKMSQPLREWRHLGVLLKV